MARLVLRDYQREAIAATYDFFARNETGNPLFVIPTGGGKSLILAEFIRRTLRAWPETRFLVVTHIKELVQQNHDEFVSHWDNSISCPAGVYSAGLGRRNTREQVIFAGIQSVHDKANALGYFDLVLIDEAHLVPKKGMGRYRTYLDDLRKINPDVRVCGYTATHFRLDGGYLDRGEGRIFTDVAYEVSLELLIEQGHLVPLVAKRPEHVVDTSEVGTSGGDFKQDELEEAAMENVVAAVSEIVRTARATGRNHWLIFACGINHAELVRDLLVAEHDVVAKCVFGKTSKDDRDEIVKAFRDGYLTALVNVGVLTTGFNAPCCDLMAVMRATQSAALYVQMMGRGMRTHPGKKDCLVLDYGCNVERHGPVNRVRPSWRREVRGEDKPPPPMTVCPSCQAFPQLGVNCCP